MLGIARTLAALFTTLVVLTTASCGDDDGEQGAGQGADRPSLLPEGGEAPPRKINDLGVAASAARCRLDSTVVDSRDHTADLAEPVRYLTNPPTSGRHFQPAAPDGSYEEVPADTAVVHAFEHGRVGIWFRPDLPERRRAQLRALAEEDATQLLVVPRRRMPYDVAASAWNRDPEPLGTGRLMTCARFTDATFDALRAFRDEHRAQGPEPIP